MNVRIPSTTLWVLCALFLFLLFKEINTSQPCFSVPDGTWNNKTCDVSFTGVNYINVAFQRGYNTYPNNVNCTLTLSESNILHSSVNLSWTWFEMQDPNANGICQDFVQLFKKDKDSGELTPLGDKFCGHTKPWEGYQVFDLAALVLWIHSDNIDSSDRGFKLLYIRIARFTSTPPVSTSENPGKTAAIAIGGLLGLGLVSFLIGTVACAAAYRPTLLQPVYQIARPIYRFVRPVRIVRPVRPPPAPRRFVPRWQTSYQRPQTFSPPRDNNVPRTFDWDAQTNPRRRGPVEYDNHSEHTILSSEPPSTIRSFDTARVNVSPPRNNLPENWVSATRGAFEGDPSELLDPFTGPLPTIEARLS